MEILEYMTTGFGRGSGRGIGRGGDGLKEAGGEGRFGRMGRWKGRKKGRRKVGEGEKEWRRRSEEGRGMGSYLSLRETSDQLAS